MPKLIDTVQVGLKQWVAVRKPPTSTRNTKATRQRVAVWAAHLVVYDRRPATFRMGYWPGCGWFPTSDKSDAQVLAVVVDWGGASVNVEFYEQD